MATARRWYFYGVAFISQLMLFAGVLGLTQEILGARGVGLTARALYIALIIVGLPVYVLHWWLAQRAVQHGDDERNAILRKVYFYGAQAVTMLVALAVLRSALERALGGQLSLAALDEYVAALVVSLAFWGYHIWLARSDAALEAETGGGASARRWYQLGLAAVGLWLWGSGLRALAIDLIRLFTTSLSAGVVGQELWSTDATTLLVGLIGWLPMWSALQRRVARDADEQHSVLRKFYLYAAVFLGAGFSLFSLAAWLQALIKIVLGDPAPPPATLTEGTGNSLVSALIGALVWAYHARVLQGDARLIREAPQQASIRRLYYYLVAALSLTALIVGVANIGETLLRLLMDWRPEFAAASGWWRERLAWGIAATLVGLPVWLRAWLLMQRTALAVDAQGREERRATLRKIYLYGVALVGALVVLFNLSSAAYQLLQIVLGESRGNVLAGNIAGAFVNSVVSAVAWLYHLYAIRQDGALAKETASVRADRALTVAVIDGHNDFGRALLAQLQRDMPTVQAIGLEPSSTADYSVQLQQADLVVLPLSELLTDAALPGTIAQSKAKVLLVPLAREGLSVLGQSTAPPTAQAVSQSIKWIQKQAT